MCLYYFFAIYVYVLFSVYFYFLLLNISFIAIRWHVVNNYYYTLYLFWKDGLGP